SLAFSASSFVSLSVSLTIAAGRRSARWRWDLSDSRSDVTSSRVVTPVVRGTTTGGGVGRGASVVRTTGGGVPTGPTDGGWSHATAGIPYAVSIARRYSSPGTCRPRRQN